MNEQVTIASVHFAPVKAERGRPLRKYVIPAAEAIGKVQTLTVNQALEYDQGPYGPNKVREQYERLITAMEIGNDLVREWTQSGIYMGPDDEGKEARPGIWLVRDRLPATNAEGVQQTDIVHRLIFRPATREEFQQMWEEDLAAAIDMDARYGDRLIKKGIAIHNDPKGHAGIPISIPMRLAARFYSVAAPFLMATTKTGVKDCQYCHSSVDVRAVYCPQCQKCIDQYEAIMIEKRDKEAANARIAAEKMAQQQKTA